MYNMMQLTDKAELPITQYEYRYCASSLARLPITYTSSPTTCIMIKQLLLVLAVLTHRGELIN